MIYLQRDNRGHICICKVDFGLCGALGFCVLTFEYDFLKYL